MLPEGGRMQIESAEWAIRPAGTSGWIPIDPDSPRGRFLAAQHGFTIPPPQKEDIAMSAIPVETTRHLRVAESNKAGYSAVLAAKAKARQAFNFITSLPKSAWAWARSTFHLEALETRVVGALGWARRVLMSGVRALGTTGLLGAGLLTASTGSGRKFLGYLLMPVVAAGQLLIRGWAWTENALFVEEPRHGLDRVRNFASERMADVRCFLFGAGTTENRYGILGNLAVKAMIKVGPYLTLDSKTMRVTRGIGALLFGAKLFTIAPMLPVAGWVVFLAQAVIATTTFVAAGEPLLSVAEEVTGIRVSTGTKKEGEQAAKVAATVTEIPVKEGPAPSNRAAKRAAGRRPQHAGR